MAYTDMEPVLLARIERLTAEFQERIAKLEAEIERLTEYAKYMDRENNRAAGKIKRLETSLLISKKKHELAIERTAKLEAALDKLARLGNEPHYGNSDGNVIAIAALQEVETDE